MTKTSPRYMATARLEGVLVGADQRDAGPSSMTSKYRPLEALEALARCRQPRRPSTARDQPFSSRRSSSRRREQGSLVRREVAECPASSSANCLAASSPAFDIVASHPPGRRPAGRPPVRPGRARMRSCQERCEERLAVERRPSRSTVRSNASSVARLDAAGRGSRSRDRRPSSGRRRRHRGSRWPDRGPTRSAAGSRPRRGAGRPRGCPRRRRGS